MESVIIPYTRIEDYEKLVLGQVFRFIPNGKLYIYVGRCSNSVGYEYYFVCSENVTWTYKCSKYSTFKAKFKPVILLEDGEYIDI